MCLWISVDTDLLFPSQFPSEQEKPWLLAVSELHESLKASFLVFLRRHIATDCVVCVLRACRTKKRESQKVISCKGKLRERDSGFISSRTFCDLKGALESFSVFRFRSFLKFSIALLLGLTDFTRTPALQQSCAQVLLLLQK